MNNLIEELKDQHKQIRVLAEKLYTEKDKGKILRELNELLAKHRESEDSKLYPFLFKTAEKDQAVADKLKFFASNWQEISEFSKFYLSTYSESQQGENFIIDTAKFLAKMKQRMAKEEIGLFSEFEKQFKNK